MKRTPSLLGILAASAVLLPGPASADGMSDPYAARAVCDKRGENKSAEALKKCCGNLILVASIKEQKKLEAQCVKGKDEKSEKKK